MEDIVKEKYLTDIAYDCYNDRMAISSTTRKIHILEKNELEEWVEVASWDSQDVVLKLQWSVPEYNNLLISCGQDKQIIIWKEDKENGWELIAKIQDFSDSVEDISICPGIHGLKVAAVTSNGFLKIFGTRDYVEYRNWDCLQTRDLNSSGCTSVCWNPSVHDPQTLVVGSKLDPSAENKGRDQLIRIFWYNEKKKEYMFASDLIGHEDTVTDVEWVNTYGRTYHFIASVSLDKSIIIWKLDFEFIPDIKQVDEIKIKYCQILNYKHTHPLWRVSWGPLGSKLSAEGEDGKVLIFYNNNGMYEQMIIEEDQDI